MAYLKRAGERIFYEVDGLGVPAMVFVHGFGCGHEDWRHQVEHFRGSHLVVTPDLRGHGQSRHCTRGFDIPTYGADVLALLDALGLGPAVLVGHSMGCRVVLEAARRDPRACAGVVLVDGSRQARGDPESAARSARAAVAEAGLQAFTTGLFAGMFVATSDAEMRDRIMRRAAELPEAVGGALFADMVRWDAAESRAALAALEAPLLVLQSTYVDERRERWSLEVGATSPWLEMINTTVPGARIEILPGIGHFTMLEAPVSFNDHLQGFVDDLGARA